MCVDKRLFDCILRRGDTKSSEHKHRMPTGFAVIALFAECPNYTHTPRRSVSEWRGFAFSVLPAYITAHQSLEHRPVGLGPPSPRELDTVRYSELRRAPPHPSLCDGVSGMYGR